MRLPNRAAFGLLAGILLILPFGHSCTEGIMSPPAPAPQPAQQGLVVDRAQDDFEGQVLWTGVGARPDLWTVTSRTDRPEGDAHVCTNTDTTPGEHLALWVEASPQQNLGSSFQVLAQNGGNSWMGIVTNYQPGGAFYLFRVQPGDSLWEVQRVDPAGSQVLAFGVAEDQGKLLVPDEYILIRLGWSSYTANVLEASIVSPSMGSYTLASLAVSSPLPPGRAGVYCIRSGTYFDDARLDGVIPLPARPTLTVHAGQPRESISQNLYGANFIWRGDINGIPNTIYDELTYRSALGNWFQLLGLVQNAGIGSTRYPGGIESSFYYWKHGVGPVSSRCNPGNLSAEDTITVGTDEFLQFTEELGAEAVITLNPTHLGLPMDDPAVAQYAADWVEYCNAPNDGSNPGGGVDFAALRAANGHAAPYGVKYWEIANEIAGGTTQELAAIIRSVSEATLAIDATIQLGFQDHVFTPPYNQDPFSPSAKNYYTNPQGTGILDLAGDDFHFWEPHPYGPASFGIGPAFSQNGAGLSVLHTFPAAGTYLFRLRALCSNPTSQPVRGYRYGTLRVKLNDTTVWFFEVASISEQLWSKSVTVPAAGTWRISIEGDNLIQGRQIQTTNTLEVVNQTTGAAAQVDLTNSGQVYGFMQATAPHVQYVYYGLFQDYYGGKPLYPTEWNTTTGFYDAPNDLKWALSNADYLNVFLRNGTRVSSFWDLSSNRLLVGLLEGVPEGYPDPRLRPTAYVFELYRNLLRGHRLDVDPASIPFYLRGIDGLSLGVVGQLTNLRVPWLSSVAALSPAGDSLSLIVINKHPDLPLLADVRLDGFTSSGYATISQIDAASIATNNERDSCPDPGTCVRTVTSTWTGATSAFSYLFPAHSVTAFTFYAPGASAAPPQPPASLSAEAVDSSVHLEWSASPSGGVTAYCIYRSRQPEGPYGNRVNASPVSSTEYTDAGLDPGVTYYYAVRATDQDGNEGVFSPVAAARIAGSLPVTYHAEAVEILSGTPNGSIEALNKGDYYAAKPLAGPTFYRVASAVGSTDWALAFRVTGNRATLSSLALYFQAIYSRPGTQRFYVWNFTRTRWDPVRTQEVHDGQIERYMEAFSSPTFIAEHVSPMGDLKLRIEAVLGGTFTCYADYCAVTAR